MAKKGSDETPGSKRNQERVDRGEAQRGRPPKVWPKNLPRKPVEADDFPDDDGRP